MEYQSSPIGAVLIVVLVPYFVGQAVAFGLTARTFPPGVSLWFGYVLMGVGLIVFAVATGWAFGNLLPARFAALAALMVWLVVQLSSSDSSGLTVISGPSWEAPRLSALAIRITAGAICVGLVAAHPRIASKRLPRAAAGIGAAVLAAIVAVTAIGTTTVMAVRDVPTQPACIDGTIEFCVWPEEVKYAPLIEIFDDRLATIPDGFVIPERVSQYGLIRQPYSSRGQTGVSLEGIDVSEGSHWALASGIASEVISETIEDCDLDGLFEDQNDLESVSHWLGLYIADEGPEPANRPNGVPDEILESWAVAENIVATQPVDQQVSWASTTITDLVEKHCEPV